MSPTQIPTYFPQLNPALNKSIEFLTLSLGLALAPTTDGLGGETEWE